MYIYICIYICTILIDVAQGAGWREARSTSAFAMLRPRYRPYPDLARILSVLPVFFGTASVLAGVPCSYENAQSEDPTVAYA